MARRRRGTKREADKLKSIRRKFENAVEHNDHAHSEMHRAGRFYHNTRGEGQWELEDKNALTNEGRPCYAFNICKEKVDSFLGIYGDAERTPMATGTGGEDELLAEALDIVAQQVLEDAGFAQKKAAALKSGTIAGEASLQVEFRPHDDNPSWVQVFIHRLSPFELNWDEGSIEPDRSDANHFFWDRWMSEEQFARWYPEDARDFQLLANSAGADPQSDGVYSANNNAEPVNTERTENDYRHDFYNRYYFDRRRNKARVIRYEYKTNVRQHYSVDREDGQMYPITRKERRSLESAARRAGIDVEIVTVMKEQVKVCEFIGNRILAEYDTAGPFKGFSVSPFTYAIDEEEGTAYGALRNLFDPQMELNKANSLLIETIANGSATGTIAEESAIEDEDSFKQERRTPNGVAFVADGALTTGAVKERESYPLSPAVVARAQASIELIDRISGIPSQGMVTPASQAEAATTVALRHHKSKQIVADPIANYEWMVKDTFRKVVEGIVRSMPDDQFEAIMARDQAIRVEDGMIYEMGPNPQQPDGPEIPVRQAELRNIEQLAWNTEMELRSENTTLRVLEFDTILKLVQANVPVDPEVLVELATGSRSKRERLTKYVEQAMQQMGQQQQTEQQMAAQNMQLLAQNERAKLMETHRANRAKEVLQAQKQSDDRTISLLEVWEKADNDERVGFLSMLSLLMQNTEAATQPAGPPPGTLPQ